MAGAHLFGRLGLGLVGMSLAWACQAHLMPAQHGTVNIVGKAAFVALAVPVSALAAVDDNRDGRLSALELDRHNEAVVAQISARLRLSDGAAEAPAQVLQVSAEPDERQADSTGAAQAHASPTTGAGATYFLALVRFGFDAPPSALRVETDLFGHFAAEKQLTLRVTRGSETDVVVLTPSRKAQVFFQAPGQVAQQYLQLGLEHILLGWDHLLFLLTIMVGAHGWRYWVALLTTFTVAHSMTLAAGLLGWVLAPAAWIEPLIATSIVLMALLNLRRRPQPVGRRMALVFGCGLLHGLGFAGSMSEMGLHASHLLPSLVGFNVGIELGQAAFVLVVLAGAVLWRRVQAAVVTAPGATALWPGVIPAHLASWCAVGVGGFWLLERLGALV